MIEKPIVQTDNANQIFLFYKLSLKVTWGGEGGANKPLPV